MFFCQHNWEEKERFYALPTKDLVKVENCAELLFQEMMFGKTTILYKCSKCTNIKFIEILGKSEKE